MRQGAFLLFFFGTGMMIKQKSKTIRNITFLRLIHETAITKILSLAIHYKTRANFTTNTCFYFLMGE